MKKSITWLVVSVGFLLIPSALHAQTLSQLMFNEFTRNIATARTPAGVGVVVHDAVFQNDTQVTKVTDLIQQVSQQISSQVSNFPLGSSSGGFTYRYDSKLGTFTRSTQTFGPAFAERAPTLGRGKFNFGVNYQHGTYSSLDGRDLEAGDVKFFLLHQPLSPPSYVEGDVVEAQAKMKLSSDTTVFFFSAGLTDALDVGVAIPLQYVRMDLTYHATILDFATHTFSPLTHRFANGEKTQDTNAVGTAHGIGDVVIRGKYNFMKGASQGFGLGVDVRLPTGDEQNMLGTGATQTQFYFIGSSAHGDLSPHVNVGYTVADKSVSDQVNYVGGLEYAASPRVTILGDIIGRTFTDTLRLKDNPQAHTFQQGPTAAVESTVLEDIATETGSLTSVLGTIGAKFNPTRSLLISTHVVFTLTSAGLKRGVTPVIGFDYSF